MTTIAYLENLVVQHGLPEAHFQCFSFSLLYNILPGPLHDLSLLSQIELSYQSVLWGWGSGKGCCRESKRNWWQAIWELGRKGHESGLSASQGRKVLVPMWSEPPKYNCSEMEVTSFVCFSGSWHHLPSGTRVSLSLSSLAHWRMNFCFRHLKIITQISI